MSYNYITNRNSPNYTTAAETPRNYGMPRVIEGVVIHHWGDPNQNPQFDNIVNYLCRANGNTSAHFVATGTNRQVACIVSPGDVAWHSGSAWGNARTIGIELDPRARDEDYDVAAELVADIRSAYGDVPIYWHSYFVATSCPGAWNAERLDQLSYTKFSHATEWGKGGNKNSSPAPVTPTPTPAPVTPPAVSLYKLLVDGKQVSAYSSEANAFAGYNLYQKKAVIQLDGKDVTKSIIEKFTVPSPTAGQPDSGLPVTEKHDYSAENNGLLKEILALLTSLVSKISNIFK
jgi:hypothetical protein